MFWRRKYVYYVVGCMDNVYICKGEYDDDHEFLGGPFSSKERARKWALKNFPDGKYVSLNWPGRPK